MDLIIIKIPKICISSNYVCTYVVGRGLTPFAHLLLACARFKAVFRGADGLLPSSRG